MANFSDIDTSDAPGVYYIAHQPTGKIYIGESDAVRARLLGHHRQLTLGNHPNKDLQADWSHYGEPEFIFGVIDVTPTINRKQLEKHYIKVYQSEDPKLGYNHRPGGVPGARRKDWSR
jgi:group I intron endonuclease